MNDVETWRSFGITGTKIRQSIVTNYETSAVRRVRFANHNSEPKKWIGAELTIEECTVKGIFMLYSLNYELDFMLYSLDYELNYTGIESLGTTSGV